MCPISRRWRDARKQREQTAKVLLAATELVQPEELAEAVDYLERGLAKAWTDEDGRACADKCGLAKQAIWAIGTVLQALRQQQAAQEVIAR